MAAGSSVNHVRKIKVSGKPIKEPGRLPWPRTAEDGTELGVDVQAKRQDIIKIVHKYFRVPDVPMEELMQEVFLQIIHKNYGRSAHDPRKSSFGHYVYLVANNVCINLVHRKKRFEKERDSLDAPNGHDDSRTLLDTVEAYEEPDDQFQDRMEEVEAVMRRRGMWDLARYVRAARSGASPDVVREALSWGGREVTNRDIRDMRHRLQEAVSALVPA